MKNKKFHDFEFGFWNVTAAPYDAGIGPITSQTTERMLAHLDLKKGDRLLDVACGPGYITRDASDIKVTGVDFSDAMIALAKQTYPNSDFKVANAEDLPFEDNTFDGVCCNFGILHFANPDIAMKEAFRVCKPGAKYAFTAWNSPDKSPAFAFLMGAIQKYATADAGLPEGPPFFHYGLEENSYPALTKAGFRNMKREEADYLWPMQSAENFVRGFYDGGARMGGILRAQNHTAIQNIIQSIDEKIKPYKSDAGYAVPVSVVITTAQK